MDTYLKGQFCLYFLLLIFFNVFIMPCPDGVILHEAYLKLNHLKILLELFISDVTEVKLS